jgi:Zn-dependent protease
MSPFRAARSRSWFAARTTSGVASAAFACLSAVRKAERCARLRTVAARVLRTFFSADAIFGTDVSPSRSSVGIGEPGKLARPGWSGQRGASANREWLRRQHCAARFYSLATRTCHARLALALATRTRHSPLATRHSHSPLALATRTRHSHSPLALATRTRHSHSPLATASLRRYALPPKTNAYKHLDRLENFLLAFPVLLFSMVAHEYAHGYAALKQGDPTAYQLGRLTWNPIKHIDPIFTIAMPALTYFFGGFIFGGAKPVPVVPRNYRNFRRGDIIVSLAGIATNLVLAVVCTGLIVVLGLLGRSIDAAADTLGLLQRMMVMGVIFNLILAVFNLLPIPPLDGSHVMKYLLPASWALQYQRFGMYGMVVLILMMATGFGQRILVTWLTPALIAYRKAQEIVMPYMLTSQFGMGF